MPWKECSIVSQREVFVKLAQVESGKFSVLCSRFGISRRTGYKWLSRYDQADRSSLLDRSRRPLVSPEKTCATMEAAVLSVRALHPVWGGRKIRRVLLNEGQVDVPSASTITMILHRHGLICPEESSKHKAWTRFERAKPNDLWQMDFKGHYALADRRCHPLTVLDDHSRYCVGLRACSNERTDTVRTHLTDVFRSHGLPRRFLMDNGPPWGGDRSYPWTRLTVWLIELGVHVSHGRPYHPQTQGKEERFHRTLQAEVLNRHHPDSFSAAQRTFDDWRIIYNLHRPHEALNLDTPVTRYAVSPRSFPEVLLAPSYGPDDQLRKVQGKGEVHFHGGVYCVGRAFVGRQVAIRPSDIDGCWEVYFHHQRIAKLNERTGCCSCERMRWDEHKWGEPGWDAQGASACQASVRSAHSSPAGREDSSEKKKT